MLIFFVFFFSPVYMREPKNPDKLFEKKFSTNRNRKKPAVNQE